MTPPINKLNWDKIIFVLFGVSFFIGIWHALPILNVISDEMYYVGGVLRAMEAHTFIPKVDDVPYGTITYLLNYIATIFNLMILFPIFSFSLVKVKFYLLQNPSLMYLSTRIVSAIIALFYLYIVSKFLKKENFENKIRYFLIILLFTNIITTAILHTGKMWVLSIFLLITSFYYLYLTVANETEKANRDRSAFLSIIFSFLALSNLPLNAFSLINIPIIIYFFFQDKEFINKKIPKYIIAGILLSGMIIAINSGGIKHQIVSVFTGYNPVLVDDPTLPKMSFPVSLLTYLKKLICLYPLLLLTIILSVKNGLRNKKLFIISTIYFLTYFFILVTVATWPVEFGSFLRYLVPLNFFLFFMLSGVNIKFKKIFYPIITLSIFYFLLTLYYLSVPTTYNQASKWVEKNLKGSNVTIINNVHDFRLTKNKTSSLVTQEIFCGTKCKETIEKNLNSDFKPLVLDDQSTAKATTSIKSYKGMYIISENPINENGYVLLSDFTNPGKSQHEIDFNIGNYFDLSYLKLKNLGRNIYIYRVN